MADRIKNPDAHRHGTHTGKKAYTTREEARRAVSLAWKMNRQLLTYYKCDYCPFLHVGHITNMKELLEYTP